MNYFFLVLILIFSTLSFSEQIELQRVNEMSHVPEPLMVLDFKKLAQDFDQKVYDFKAKGEFWPLIWLDESENNFKGPTLGMYTTIGDVRQGPLRHSGTFHESLANMGGVLGASLVGIDKSKQEYNFVSMLKHYFNRDNGWMIMQNNTNPKAGAQGGGYGRDWWYDVYPNLLFYAVYDQYPHEKDFEDMARSIADKFYEADKILGGNYGYSYFDYGLMLPMTNWICPQVDAAAGHSWVLYSAYKKFGDKKYLAGARSALTALSQSKTNPSYEVLMPFGALMAAKLNALHGDHFDVKKMLDWTFDGTAVCREGWGVLVGKWNGYDISGTMGSTVDHGGYGFLMNTFDMAWPVVPIVRYDQRFSNAIGKWALHAANAIKLFYPDYLPENHQTLKHLSKLTKGVIAYEGIVKSSTHDEYRNITQAPVAQGDGPKWVEGNPDVTQFSVYGSAHVGIFGSIISKTNVPGILKLNLLATDFFKDEAYPTSLYYNPYNKPQAIKVTLKKRSDLYDLVSQKFVGRNVVGKVSLKLKGLSSMVIIETPVGGKVTQEENKLLVNGVVIDYRTKR